MIYSRLGKTELMVSSIVCGLLTQTGIDLNKIQFSVGFFRDIIRNFYYLKYSRRVIYGLWKYYASLLWISCAPCERCLAAIALLGINITIMEKFYLYNYDRTLSGKIIERGNPVPDGYYRLVVVVLIFNSKGELLIQQGASRELKEELFQMIDDGSTKLVSWL